MVDVLGVHHISLLTPLIAICTALAWCIALGWRGRPAYRYRPIAWLLAWLLVSDLARAALQALALLPARAAAEAPPYRWPVVAAYHVEQALALAWPVALATTAGVVFLRRRAWGVTVSAWGALAIGSAVAYPWLRLDRRDTAHAIVDTAALLLVGAFAARSVLVRLDEWRSEHLALGAIVAAEFGVLVSVLWWSDPGAHWEIARRVNAVAYGLLLAGQAWHIWGRK